MSKNYMAGGKVCSHGSGLEPFLLGALHAKIPGKELSKGGEGGGTNRQFREGRNKGEEKGDQKNGRARDLLIKQHREVPESWPRRRREGVSAGGRRPIRNSGLRQRRGENHLADFNC